MKTAIEIELTFEQVLEIVRQMPFYERQKLVKEVEKELLKAEFTSLLHEFKTDDISLEVIDNEAETVREKLYAERELKSNF